MTDSEWNGYGLWLLAASNLAGYEGALATVYNLIGVVSFEECSQAINKLNFCKKRNLGLEIKVGCLLYLASLNPEDKILSGLLRDIAIKHGDPYIWLRAFAQRELQRRDKSINE